MFRKKREKKKTGLAMDGVSILGRLLCLIHGRGDGRRQRTLIFFLFFSIWRLTAAMVLGNRRV